MEKKAQSLVWRIGGAQGHGIDTAAAVFARSCAKAGLSVLGRREYHSNIMGRHSFSDIRISNEPINGHCSSTDILVCLDAESLCRHIEKVAANGFIIVDAAETDVDLNTLKFLDKEIKNRLQEKIQQANQPMTVAGLITTFSSSSLTLVYLPVTEFLTQLQKKFPISHRVALRTKNMLLLAVSAALLTMPEKKLLDEVLAVFQGKDMAIEYNCYLIQQAYNYIKNEKLECLHCLPKVTANLPSRLLVSGYQSIALGKLAAGMAMQPYYPISPATDESLYLESQETNAIIIQTEDELAAITMSCGAALTGVRVATSTSGPGFSLMVEGLGWAGMNEVPLVITLYQRGGPSTGMPTRTEQADLQFVIHAGHGEFPRIVLASGDITDCYYDAFQSFNYADRYQLPVIHIIDKNLASTKQTVASFNTAESIDRGVFFKSEGDTKHIPRFEINDSGISPRAKLGEVGQLFWSSGVEHSEYGQVSENSQQRKKMMEKRARKLQVAMEEIPLQEKLTVYGGSSASITLISWGSTQGVIIDALEYFKQQGNEIRAIMIKLLWPFPAVELNTLLNNDDTLVVIECNQSGQLNSLLKEQAGVVAAHQLLKYTGRPFTIEDIVYYINQVISGCAEKIISVDDI